jgi:hypothetical protein
MRISGTSDRDITHARTLDITPFRLDEEASSNDSPMDECVLVNYMNEIK